MIYIVLLYSADVIYTLYIQAIYIYIRTVSTAKQYSTCIYVCLYFPAIAFVCSLSSVKTAIDLIIYCNYLIDNLRIMDSVHSFVASLDRKQPIPVNMFCCLCSFLMTGAFRYQLQCTLSKKTNLSYSNLYRPGWR